MSKKELRLKYEEAKRQSRLAFSYGKWDKAMEWKAEMDRLLKELRA